jgi:hypothetical protein
LSRSGRHEISWQAQSGSLYSHSFLLLFWHRSQGLNKRLAKLVMDKNDINEKRINQITHAAPKVDEKAYNAALKSLPNKAL